MFATVDLITARPELAQVQFRASNRWIDGARNRSAIKGFYAAGGEDASRSEAFELDAGESAILLGTDTGPNPGEYPLHALAASLTTSDMVTNGVPVAVDVTTDWPHGRDRITDAFELTARQGRRTPGADPSRGSECDTPNAARSTSSGAGVRRRPTARLLRRPLRRVPTRLTPGEDPLRGALEPS